MKNILSDSSTHLKFQIRNDLFELGDALSLLHVPDPLSDCLVLQLPLHVRVLPHELLRLVLLLLDVSVLEIEVGLKGVHQASLTLQLVESQLGLSLQLHHFQTELLQLRKT